MRISPHMMPLLGKLYTMIDTTRLADGVSKWQWLSSVICEIEPRNGPMNEQLALSLTCLHGRKDLNMGPLVHRSRAYWTHDSTRHTHQPPMVSAGPNPKWAVVGLRPQPEWPSSVWVQWAPWQQDGPGAERKWLDIWDRAVRRQEHRGLAYDIYIWPEGVMDSWEKRLGDLNQEPGATACAAVRMGKTAEVKLHKKAAKGEVWFVGATSAWNKLDWGALKTFEQSDMGVQWGKAVSDKLAASSCQPMQPSRIAATANNLLGRGWQNEIGTRCPIPLAIGVRQLLRGEGLDSLVGKAQEAHWENPRKQSQEIWKAAQLVVWNAKNAFKQIVHEAKEAEMEKIIIPPKAYTGNSWVIKGRDRID